MGERILNATVNFRMIMMENETYEEARERFLDCVLYEAINLADHEVDWDLESCEEE
jgi:hypothetical protein